MDQTWAVVLGASSGMGLATAKKLASHGMNLILVHRDRRSTLDQVGKEFDELRKKVRVLSFNDDALNADKRLGIVDQIKSEITENSIAVLVHSVAKGNLKKLSHAELEKKADNKLEARFESVENERRAIDFGKNKLEELDFTLTNQAMATSMLSWTNDLLENNLFSEKARVIGITSEGDWKVWPGYGAVAVAKSSLETLAKYMAVEFAPHGLRVNLVHAGVTDTPSLNMIPGSDLMKASAKFRNPYGRLTQPEDVANAIYLLCLPEADWINGSRLMVDGGENLT
ncbi:MAG: SDR family oxidoreductase [Cyclobacteriaceae bacterium]